MRPVLLAANNFTPLTRTPWAGEKIVGKYKGTIPELQGKSSAPTLARRIGESWEFSCDDSFPSRAAMGGHTLAELLKADPEGCLSRRYIDQVGRAECEILVKLIDTALPLSLQVHPEDHDPNLAEGECGKPEAWYILDVQEGAGIYLGFSAVFEPEQLKARLESGQDLSEWLQFIPVRPGDYFEIQPGVPHAIGGGVTLLEPQRVRFGESGKTYRIWDWGRRYDGSGQLNPSGQPRELHVDAALGVMDLAAASGLPYVEGLRRSPEVHRLGGATLETFPRNSYCQLRIVQSDDEDAELSLNLDQGYGVLTNLGGESLVGGLVGGLVGDGNEENLLLGGQSCFLPYGCFPFHLTLRPGSKLALITPHLSRLSLDSV